MNLVIDQAFDAEQIVAYKQLQTMKLELRLGTSELGNAALMGLTPQEYRFILTHESAIRTQVEDGVKPNGDAVDGFTDGEEKVTTKVVPVKTAVEAKTERENAAKAAAEAAASVVIASTNAQTVTGNFKNTR